MTLYFLSEMAVTNQHGGGLTLQRVIQDDLKRFDAFVYVASFAKEYPPIEEFEKKSVFEYSILDPIYYKNTITLRISQYLNTFDFIKEYGARRLIRRLNKKIDLNNSCWLVCPQAEMSLRVTRILKKKYKACYITWFMDDHLVRIKTDGETYYPGNTGDLMNFVLKNAIYNWVISPAMQSFYGKLFSASSHILFGPAMQQKERIITGKLKHSNPRFIYFGAITSWQEDALVFFVKQLHSMQGELHIYSSKDSLPLSLQRNEVVFKGAVSPDRIIAIVGGYDGVILPISFKLEMAHMSRLNIATKMSECLAAGTITIAIGPPEAAMIDYLRFYNCAIIIDRQDDSFARTQLSKIYDGQLIDEILANAGKLVADYLTPDKMHTVWRKGFEKFFN